MEPSHKAPLANVSEANKELSHRAVDSVVTSTENHIVGMSLEDAESTLKSIALWANGKVASLTDAIKKKLDGDKQIVTK